MPNIRAGECELCAKKNLQSRLSNECDTCVVTVWMTNPSFADDERKTDSMMRADKSVTGCHTLRQRLVSCDIWPNISISITLSAAIPNCFQTLYEVP